MASDLAGIFPPSWKKGDGWSVVMKTLAPLPDDVPPRFVEHMFRFRVMEVPGPDSSAYRVEVHATDRSRHEAFALYYRPEDFSLEKVVRLHPGAAEEGLISNGRNPFIYYERRLFIVPDFPIAAAVPLGSAGPAEFRVADERVVQEAEVSGGRARITIERLEAMGSLRAAIEWAAGDPWWSTIECSENPPPGAPVRGQVVASGHLIKSDAVR